ncbi:hypothetical protein [Amycolatopsis sp. MJM2582]|uniref:hypothetical protein n=1 Tax=Amycolatopsis sp. MJM2582 TaxID=1427749 RepID=UPI001269B057|nr:hypothetical protein [Amycolatopsis sp. MJM2582]
MDRRRACFLVAASGIMLFLAVSVGMGLGLTEKDVADWAESTEVVVDVILAVGLLTAAIACAIALRHSRKIGEAAVDTWLPTETAVAREPGFAVLPQRFHTMSLLAIPVFCACAVALGLVAWFSVAIGSPAPAILPGIPLALGCAGGLSAWVGWDRRAKSVRKTGWYAAKVVDIEVFRANDLRLPAISVGFEDGSMIGFSSSLSTYDAGHRAGRRALEVWVGGEDAAMVVLFENGRFRIGLYPVPVKAIGPRTFPRSLEPPRGRASGPSWAKRVDTGGR